MEMCNRRSISEPSFFDSHSCPVWVLAQCLTSTTAQSQTMATAEDDTASSLLCHVYYSWKKVNELRISSPQVQGLAYLLNLLSRIGLCPPIHSPLRDSVTT